MSTQDWIFDKRNGVFVTHPDYKPEWEVLDKEAFDEWLRNFLRLKGGFMWWLYEYPRGRKDFDDLAKYVDVPNVVRRIYAP